MVENETKNTIDYNVKSINLADIYMDNHFNCRGHIAPIDVVDLMRSIDINGLLEPISVQPYGKVEGKKYRVLAGHRRLTAFKLLKRETIPCYIRENLTEIEARTINLIENLKRSDLNMLQEAKAIKDYRNWDFSIQETANMIGMTPAWVQIRFYILDFPEDVQNEIAAGYLNQTQIRDLHNYKWDELRKAVKEIKEKKERGEKAGSFKKPKKKNPHAIRRRDRAEMLIMQATLRDIFGPCFYTRLLAWCNAEVSDYEIQQDLLKEAAKVGKKYNIPDEFRIE